jgi:hypothetical protein
MLIAVSSATMVANKDFKSADEAQFGTALADCMLPHPHPHLPHRIRAPPHLVFGKSSVWVRRPAINGIELAYTAAKSMYTARSLAS